MNAPAQIHVKALYQRITAGKPCALIEVRTARKYCALYASVTADHA
jgi:hypothetical protein